MDHILREVEVQCLPDRIPEYLELDVTPLLVGQSLHVRDMQPEGVQLVTPADRVIVSIHGKAAEEVEEAAAAPAAEGAAAEGAAAEGAEPAAEAKDAEKDKEKGKGKGKGRDKD
jgi:large subunit ribosomal protein L25